MVRKLVGYRSYVTLLKAVKRQIREIQGPEDEELKRYYRNYASTLEKSRPRPSTLEEFFSFVVPRGVALVGDFHTLDQAQNQFVKVIRALHARDAAPALALEMVQAHHDEVLAEYLVDPDAEEGTFLEKTGFFEHWGFDFSHYRPILTLARTLGLAVHGINTERSLEARDRFMAQRIADLRSRYTDRPILVLVGDLHLAPRHLPAELAALGITPTLLFQNSESVIMGRMRRGLEPYGWFHLDDERFLVNNTPPWVKMLTYRTWLEHGGEALCTLYGACGLPQSGSDDDEEGAGGTVDLTEMVHGIIRMLKDLFDLHLKADDTFQVFSMLDLDFLDDPYFRRQPGRTYAALIKDGRALFMKRGNTLYLPMMDVNRTVQEAAHFLMGADLDVGAGPEAFFRRLHYYASGFVASKLINPLRHYRTQASMRKAKEEWSRARTVKDRRYAERQLSVFKNTLDFFDLVEHYGSCAAMPMMELQRFLAADQRLLFALSEQIGFQLGEGLYKSYNAGELSGEELKHYLFSQVDPFHYYRTFKRHLQEVVEGEGPA